MADATQIAPRRELRSLHLLRAVACLMVMLCHTDGTEFGQTGVDFFFVLSGFLLMYSTRNKESETGFWRRRLRRIVPLYWGMTLVTALFVNLLPGLFRSYVFTPAYLIKSLLFLPYTHDGMEGPLMALGWTLNYEMFFTFLFWIAMKLSRRHRGTIALGMLGGLVILGHAVPLPFVLSYWSRPVLLEFGWGILIYLLWNRLNGSVLRFTGRKRNSLLPTLGTLLVLAVGIFAMEWLYGLGVPRAFGSGVLAAFLLGLFVLLDPFIRVPDAVKAIAGDSYALYLIHPYPVRAIDLCFSRFLGETPIWTGILNVALSTALLMILFAAARKTLGRVGRFFLG